MAGSLTWREYTSDDGTPYSIRVDESNANAFGTAGSSLLAIRTANSQQLPRGVRKRYILCQAQSNANLRRKFYVGTQAQMTTLRTQASKTITAADYPTANGAGAGVANTWVITYFQGEKARIPADFSAIDTGLDDGTASQ